MTAQTRPTNTGRFEQGDQPQGSDFADLIDSFIAIVDTTAQTIASTLTAAGFTTSGTISGAIFSGTTYNAQTVNATSEVNTVLVSAVTLDATNIVASNATVASLTGNTATITTFQASTVSGGTITAGEFICNASARFSSNAQFNSVVSASSIYVAATAVFNGSLFSIASGAGAANVVKTTAGNPVDLNIITSAGGRTMCRGFTKIRIEGTVAYIPFFYAT